MFQLFQKITKINCFNLLNIVWIGQYIENGPLSDNLEMYIVHPSPLFGPSSRTMYFVSLPLLPVKDVKKKKYAHNLLFIEKKWQKFFLGILVANSLPTTPVLPLTDNFFLFIKLEELSVKTRFCVNQAFNCL